MRSRKNTLPNLGSAKSPIDLGHGASAYRRNGRWHYRNEETIRHFGLQFIEATDEELIRELAMRGYRVLTPAHECVDRPNLVCPACEMAALRALGIRPKRCRQNSVGL